MKPLPRLIFLSQLFDPEPTFKGGDFIAGLTERGIEVEVVTGFPNYPGGNLYDGYRIRALQRDRQGQVEVTRLAMYPSHDRSVLRRMATYLSFMLTSFLYLTFRARKADLIYVYYPALTAGLAAVAAALFRRIPVILDVQDMWPDSLGSSGMMRNRLVLGLANVACSLLYRCCAHILVLSPGFKALLVARGVPEGKITVIYNWAEETPRPDGGVLPPGFDPTDAFRVLFAGNMGTAQNLDTVLDAAVCLRASHSGCRFYFMGAGVEVERLKQAAHDRNLGDIRFLPRVPLAQVQQFLAAADALLVHLTDEPLYRITIPSKTQAYLYAGRPILMGVAGDAAELVRRADAGYAFVPGDAEDLAGRIRELIADGAERRHQMGQNGHEFYMANLRRELALAQTVDAIYRFSGSRAVRGPL
jgi:colanic acid biosynthesis glycosyl transferase WcaI